VTSKALHETGIAVPATVTASDIRVDTVIETGDSRLGQNGLGEDFSYFHKNYYNGTAGISKGLSEAKIKTSLRVKRSNLTVLVPYLLRLPRTLRVLAMTTKNLKSKSLSLLYRKIK
jgi:hypothetical protein